MNLWVYYNRASKKKVNKNSSLALRFGFSGYFREETSITDPVVEIEIYNGQKHYKQSGGTNVEEVGTYLENLELLQRCNYVQIPSFKTSDTDIDGRYYYITEIEHISSNNEKGLFRLHLHCDLLMSFRRYISQQSAMIIAQENASDSDLFYNTGLYKPTNKRLVTIQNAVKSSSNQINRNNRSLVIITTSKPFGNDELFPSS